MLHFFNATLKKNYTPAVVEETRVSWLKINNSDLTTKVSQVTGLFFLHYLTLHPRMCMLHPWRILVTKREGTIAKSGARASSNRPDDRRRQLS